MAKIQLEALDTNFIVANKNSTVNGLDGDQTIAINANVTGTTVDSTIEDIDFSGAVADYQFQNAGGGYLKVINAAGETISTIKGAAGKTVSFTDGTAQIASTFDAATSTAVLTLGGTAISTTAAAVVPTTLDATDKSSITTDSGSTDSGSTGITGDVHVLTSGMDTLAGTDNDDTYFAVIDETTATNTTFQTFDSVDGGNGKDTLSVTLAGDGTGANGADYDADSSLSNMEVIKVKATGETAKFDADGLTTATNLVNNSSSQNLTFDNVESLSTSTDLYKTTSTTTTTVNFKDSILDGVDDTANISLERATGASTIVLTSKGNNDLENVKITSNGTEKNVITTLTVKDNGNVDTLNKLTVDGAAQLTITNAIDFAGTTTTDTATVDASTMTGNLIINVDDADVNLVTTVKGGSGDDTVDFKDSFTTTDSIDGGTGTDTLIIDSVADASTVKLTDYSISNVEVLQVAGADEASITIDADSQVGINKVVFVENADGSNNNGDTYTVTNLAAGAEVELQNTVDNRDMNTVSIGLKDASGAADALTVTVKGTTSHGTDNNVDDISFSNIETLNLDSSYVGTTSASALAATEFNTIDDISSDTTLTTINVTGTEKINVTLGAEMTNLTSFDASTATDSVVADFTNLTSKTVVKTGAGADLVTMAAKMTNEDNIDTGAGTDKVAITVGTATTATTGKFTIANAEAIALTHTNGQNATVDASLITGAELISVVGSAGDATGTLTITGLAATTAVGVAKGNTFDGTLDVTLADATGATDSLTINLAEETTGANQTDLTLKTAATIETVVFDVNAKNEDATGTANKGTANVGDYDVVMANAKAATVSVINGASTTDVDLNTLSTTTTTLDTSAFAGTVTATGATGIATTYNLGGKAVQTITASTADDIVTIASTTATHVINAGTATGDADVLNITLDGTVTASSIQDFETINVTVNASKTANVTSVSNFYNNIATTLNITGGNSLSKFVTASDIAATTNDLTKIDASTFEGTVALSLDSNALKSTLVVTGAKSTTDVVNAAFANSQTIKMSAVETFAVTATADVELNMADVTGLTKLTYTDTVGGGADDIILTDLANGVDLELTSTASTTTATIDLKDKVANTANVQNVKLVTAASADDDVLLVATDIETLNIESASANQIDLDLSGVSMTTAGKTTAVTITGAEDLEISNMNVDIASVDASAMTNNLLITGRSNSSAMDIKSGTGTDTIIMANADDTLDAGTGTDTLDINFGAILGGLQVDLSSTTDQVTSMNGSANAAVQVGFENVDASGYTGTFGASITAATTGSKITGTINDDSITLGAGADIVNFNTVNGSDVISSFTVNSDTLNFDGITGINSDGVDFAASAAKVADATDTAVYTFLGAGTGGDTVDYTVTDAATVLADVATFLTASLTAADGEKYIAVINDLVGDDAYAYLVQATSTTAAGIEAAELTLIGTINDIGAIPLDAAEIA